MENTDILRFINRLGGSGRQFQFRELREALGVSTSDKNGSARVYNYLAELKKEGVVAEVPGARTRNKYFRVQDDSRLRELLGFTISASNTGAHASLPPGRITRLETAVGDLQENIQIVMNRLDQLDARINELLAMWS